MRQVIDVGTVRYPSPGDFLRRAAAASPLAAPLAALRQAERDALIDELSTALKGHADDGVVFPIESYFAAGRP